MTKVFVLSRATGDSSLKRTEVVHCRTFAELVVLQAVVVQKHSAVALKLLALRRRPQLCCASLGQRPLLFARSPASEGETPLFEPIYTNSQLRREATKYKYFVTALW